jgi:hypothetical protein
MYVILCPAAITINILSVRAKADSACTEYKLKVIPLILCIRYRSFRAHFLHGSCSEITSSKRSKTQKIRGYGRSGTQNFQRTNDSKRSCCCLFAKQTIGYFMRFFELASTFLTPKLPLAALRTN